MLKFIHFGFTWFNHVQPLVSSQIRLDQLLWPIPEPLVKDNHHHHHHKSSISVGYGFHSCHFFPAPFPSRMPCAKIPPRSPRFATPSCAKPSEVLTRGMGTPLDVHWAMGDPQVMDGFCGKSDQNGWLSTLILGHLHCPTNKMNIHLTCKIMLRNHRNEISWTYGTRSRVDVDAKTRRTGQTSIAAI